MINFLPHRYSSPNEGKERKKNTKGDREGMKESE
jgi:hypothetical protein